MNERFFAYVARKLEPFIVAFIAIEVDRQLKAREQAPSKLKPFIGRKRDADSRSDP